MTRPVHYDLGIFEARLRAQSAEAIEQQAEMVAGGVTDPMVAAAQNGFEEACVQFALAIASLSNDGVPDDAICIGAGAAAGCMAGSLLSKATPAAIAEFFRWMTKTYNDVRMAAAGMEPSDGAVVVSVTEAPIMQSSRA